MTRPKVGFIKGRLNSLKFAFRGAWLLVSTEHAMMIQFVFILMITVLGFLMGLTSIEWMFQLLAIGLVIVTESINTAIEKLCDFVHPNMDKRIGIIKDISAGASLFASLIAVIIGLIIYLPKFF